MMNEDVPFALRFASPPLVEHIAHLGEVVYSAETQGLVAISDKEKRERRQRHPLREVSEADLIEISGGVTAGVTCTFSAYSRDAMHLMKCKADTD